MIDDKLSFVNLYLNLLFALTYKWKKLFSSIHQISLLIITLYICLWCKYFGSFYKEEHYLSYIFCNYCFAVVACHYFIIIFLFFFLFFLTPYCCCWCWLWLGINLRINCWLFSFRAAFLSMFENTTETKPPVAVPATQNVAPLAEPSLRGKVSHIAPLCWKPLPSLKL